MRTAAALVAMVVLLSGERPLVSRAEAPTGTEAMRLDWINITVPGVGTMLAAVGKPTGPGPFATVVVLHGTHGFAREYARLAKEMSAASTTASSPNPRSTMTKCVGS